MVVCLSIRMSVEISLLFHSLAPNTKIICQCVVTSKVKAFYSN